MTRVAGTRSYWDAVVDGETRRGNPLWRAHCDAINAGWLRDRLPSHPGRVLKTDLYDEAVGQGVYEVLADRAETVVGVDVSSRAISAARSRHPGLDAHVADVRALPFSDGRFDAVVSLSTLDHFESSDELVRALAELYRVLAPGGTLLLTLDNGSSPVVVLRNALPFGVIRALRLVPYPVGATVGRRRLERLLAEQGFDLLETTALMHCPRVLAVPLAQLARSGGTRLGRRYLDALLTLEALAARPTRFATGHYLAVHAVRRKAG